MHLWQRRSITWLSSLGVCLCTGYLAWRFSKTYVWNDELDTDSFIRYLLGLLLEIGVVWLIAHLNYRAVFLRFYGQAPAPWRSAYWLWLGLLTLGLFALSEMRSGFEPEFADENVLVALLLIGFVTGYAFIVDSFRIRRLQLTWRRMQAEQELQVLKSQLKPHFLFNALNTVFGAALKNGDEETADLVSQLAELMRFMLQKASSDFIGMEEELAFLGRYLALQQARLPERPNIDLQLHTAWDGQPAQIPPLLLIPLIENAFQYGLSMDQPCFIHLHLQVKNSELTLQLNNSVRANAAQRKGANTGLANLRKRLALLYPQRHQLHIAATDAEYRAHLSLSLTP